MNDLGLHVMNKLRTEYFMAVLKLIFSFLYDDYIFYMIQFLLVKGWSMLCVGQLMLDQWLMNIEQEEIEISY